MSLTASEMTPADIAACTGGNGNGGFGDFGGGWWIILLFILLGGWGNGFGGNGGNGGLYPWMNQSNQISDGFRDQMLNTSINSIQNGVTSGFGDVQNALCAGFAGVNAAITGAQMADLERSFAMQVANTQGLNQIQSALSQCCCDNRLAVAQTQALVQSENCADRAVLSDGIRDIIANQSANTQRILDQICADKIDAKNEKIADLERQLTMASLAASQNAQTAAILANNEAQTTALEQYLNPPARPAYIVANPNCCQNYGGCGCGCA